MVVVRRRGGFSTGSLNRGGSTTNESKCSSDGTSSKFPPQANVQGVRGARIRVWVLVCASFAAAYFCRDSALSAGRQIRFLRCGGAIEATGYGTNASSTPVGRVPPQMVEYDFFTNEAHAARPTMHRLEFEYEEETMTTGIGLPFNPDHSTHPAPAVNDCSRSINAMDYYNRPHCINLHELSMRPSPESFVFVNCGGSRCAWKVLDHEGTTAVTLKMPKYRNAFEGGWSEWQSAAKDGIIMERLTSSPYILNAFGYCGLSQLVEYSEVGNIHDLVKRVKLQGEDFQTPVERLKVGVHISSAMADLHDFQDEESGVAAVVHMDMCCHQILFTNGVYKLNDFHMSKFLGKDAQRNEVCKGQSPLSSSYARLYAPEEQARKPVDSKAADVYRMGSVLYYVLTKQWLFEGFKSKDAVELVGKGKRSPLPPSIVNSTDYADIALSKGIRMAWHHEAHNRPSAREVSDYLRHALTEIVKETEIVATESLQTGVFPVSVPPIPKDHRYTDSDFNANI